MESMKKQEKEVKESIGIFIRMNLLEPADTSSSTGSSTFPMDYLEKNQPVHLLDLLRSALLFDSDGSTDPKSKQNSCDGSTKTNTNQNRPEPKSKRNQSSPKPKTKQNSCDGSTKPNTNQNSPEPKTKRNRSSLKPKT